MKRITSLLALVAMITTLSFAQTITGSKHDLSFTTGGIANKATTETQICVFCHTPHQKSVTATPLWNKTLSAQATYGVYTSTTLNATDITDIGGSGTVSNLCMSCHDGTVAVNSLGNAPSGGANPAMGSGTELSATGTLATGRHANLGTSLTSDHPVNFTYNAALVTADPGLKSPNSAAFVDAAHKIPLYASKLQCASCHNPHDKTNGAFLRVNNNGSALCLSCHTK